MSSPHGRSPSPVQPQAENNPHRTEPPTALILAGAVSATPAINSLGELDLVQHFSEDFQERNDQLESVLGETLPAVARTLQTHKEGQTEMVEYIRTWWQALSHWAAGATISWIDLLVSGIILVAAIAIAILFSRIIFQRLLRLSIISGTNFDVKTVAAIRMPATASIVLAGVHLALTTLSPPPPVQDLVNKVGAILAVLIGAALVNGIASATLLWLQMHLRISGQDHESSWMFPLIRRGVLAFNIIIAAMVGLDILGINITPLVAGLGIGGLAVALALQPTLSNLFAGTYIVTEGVVSVGDYVEMADGISGYVKDVNWRSTRLRTWSNNLVVIPNSLFAETIITNYSKPEDPMDVVVTCGVAYDSDLLRVEAVGLEVMERVLREHPGAERESEPVFHYEAFGESNINFHMIVRAQNRLAGFAVRSELMKQLHSRLTVEGITINYPVRTLHLPDGWSPQDGVHLPPQVSASRPPAITPSPAPPPANPPGGGGDGPDV